MSTMTLEQVRDELLAEYEKRRQGTPGDQYRAAWAKKMADAIDAHLRERESAKAAVTDYVAVRVAHALKQQGWATGGDFHEEFLPDVRAALEAVTPMLASARVPEYAPAMGDAAEAYLKRVAPDAHRLPPTMRWHELYEAMLAAAPKPETEG